VPIRILIADDHVLVRSGVRALLAADPELEIVGEAGSGEETLRLAAALAPELVLLDITMPDASGIATAQRLKEAHPDLVVLFLTMHEDEDLLHEALRTGAAGYVIKRAEAGELLQAIRSAMAGDVYIHPAMTRGLLRQPAAPQRRRGTPATELTPRARDDLPPLLRGNTNRLVADELGLPTPTVESHRANLQGKLGLTSRVELVEYAEEHDLL
jgi:two-component system response regulator NreC